ncbi:hypothetical protein Ccrd_013866 [Cynara cardunculus var. scolymus]|uniref:Uncharacterized protein n=1 Tax=Cynara cardunculus var. scolymus TaxID=59895 RepID=A0A103YET9_CYNCS|nr:hypothetical protein Ccrd_013866 [Cynara cardunculus var. scolymus]
MDRNQPRGHQNLVEWKRPMLARRNKLKGIMDPRLGQSYPLEAAFKYAEPTSKCLANEPRLRPSSEEVLQSLEQIYSISKWRNGVKSMEWWVWLCNGLMHIRSDDRNLNPIASNFLSPSANSVSGFEDESSVIRLSTHTLSKSSLIDFKSHDKPPTPQNRKNRGCKVETEGTISMTDLVPSAMRVPFESNVSYYSSCSCCSNHYTQQQLQHTH